MAVIEASGLRKDYRRLRGGRVVALDGLDLAVPFGGVFGFLGPNGSGKTTTIRCLLALVRPTGGVCRVLGRDPQRDLAAVISRIGSIVEAPALFPRFSGRRNLELLARLDELAGIGRPLVVGTSRKSFLGKLTGRPVDERLAGTIATNVLALAKGASVFRVHDVAPVSEALRVARAALAGRAEPAGGDPAGPPG